MSSTTPEPTSTTGNPVSPKVVSATVSAAVAVVLAWWVDRSLIGDETTVAGFGEAVRDLVVAAVGAFAGGFSVKDPLRAVRRR